MNFLAAEPFKYTESLVLVILVMRTDALYNHDRRVLALTVGTFLIVSGVTGVWFHAEPSSSSQNYSLCLSKWVVTGQRATPLPDVSGCYSGRSLSK